MARSGDGILRLRSTVTVMNQILEEFDALMEKSRIAQTKAFNLGLTIGLVVGGIIAIIV